MKKHTLFQNIAGSRYIYSVGIALLLGSLSLAGGVRWWRRSRQTIEGDPVTIVHSNPKRTVDHVLPEQEQNMVLAKKQIEEVPKAKAKKQRRKVLGPTLTKLQEEALTSRINTYKALQRLPGVQKKAYPEPLSKENKNSPDVLIAQMAQLQKEGAHEDAIQIIRYKLYHALKGDEAVMIEQFFAENGSISITDHVKGTAYNSLFSEKKALYEHKIPHDTSLIYFVPGMGKTLQEQIHYLFEPYVEEVGEGWLPFVTSFLPIYDLVMPIREQNRLASLLQKKERIDANLEQLEMQYDQYKITDEAFFPKKRGLYKRAKKNKKQINALLCYCGIPTPADVEELRWNAEKEMIEVYVYDGTEEYMPNLQGPKIYVYVDRDPEDPRAIPELQDTTYLKVPNYKRQTSSLYGLSHYITHIKGKAKHYIFKKGKYYLTTQIPTAEGGTKKVSREMFYKKMAYADIFCYTILKTTVLVPRKDFIDLMDKDMAEALVITWPFMAAVTALALTLFYTGSSEGSGAGGGLFSNWGTVKGGGLTNSGNMCFYNSWVQFLYNTGLYKQFYLGGLEGKGNEHLKAIMEGLSKGEVSEKALKKQGVKDTGIASMKKGAQQDPNEVAVTLRNKLEKVDLAAATDEKQKEEIENAHFLSYPFLRKTTSTRKYGETNIKSVRVDPEQSLIIKFGEDGKKEKLMTEGKLSEDNSLNRDLKELLLEEEYKGAAKEEKKLEDAIAGLKKDIVDKSNNKESVTKLFTAFIEDNIKKGSEIERKGVKNILDVWYNYPTRKMKQTLLTSIPALENKDKDKEEQPKLENELKALREALDKIYFQKKELHDELGSDQIKQLRQEVNNYVSNMDKVNTKELGQKLLASYLESVNYMFKDKNNIVIKAEESTNKNEIILNLLALEEWNNFIMVDFRRLVSSNTKVQTLIDVTPDLAIPYVECEHVDDKESSEIKGSIVLELYGIIHHQGGAHGGHYFVSARKRKIDKDGNDSYSEDFWRFNDAIKPRPLRKDEYNNKAFQKEVVMGWYRAKEIISNDDRIP
jgi:hypothetical protein